MRRNSDKIINFLNHWLSKSLVSFFVEFKLENALNWIKCIRFVISVFKKVQGTLASVDEFVVNLIRLLVGLLLLKSSYVDARRADQGRALHLYPSRIFNHAFIVVLEDTLRDILYEDVEVPVTLAVLQHFSLRS